MYHRPRMCRTCLQMSRGDFKFVSLDSVDPQWESNSPNLKEQLVNLVPDMQIDNNEAVICTPCFIALRTGYEFKKMCQLTEKKFQSYNYKYRKPFGVGPGSSQFHITLNESSQTEKNEESTFQNIKFLQSETSIDITEHHLYDASKLILRKDINTPDQDTAVAKVVSEDVVETQESQTVDELQNKKDCPYENEGNETDFIIEAVESAADDIVDSSSMVNGDDTDSNDIPENNSTEETNQTTISNDSLDKKGKSTVDIKKRFNLGAEISISKPFTKGSDRLESEDSDEMNEKTIKESLSNQNIEAGPDYFNELENVLTIGQKCDEIGSEVRDTLIGLDSNLNTITASEEDNDAIEELEKLIGNHVEAPGQNNLDKIENLKFDDGNEKEILTGAVNKTDESEENLLIKCSDNLENKDVNIVHDLNSTSDIQNNSVEGACKEDYEDTFIFGADLDVYIYDESESQNAANLDINPNSNNVTDASNMLSAKGNALLKFKKFVKCIICQKLCLNKAQLLQHCKINHVPQVAKDIQKTTLALSNEVDISLEEKKIANLPDITIVKTAKQNLNDESNRENNSKEKYIKIKSENVNHIQVLQKPLRRTSTTFAGQSAKCPICDKLFNSENILDIHMYCHTPIIASEIAYRCYLCPKTFPKENHLRMHNLQVHCVFGGVCKTCHRLFKKEIWLNNHKCPFANDFHLTDSLEDDSEIAPNIQPEILILESSTPLTELSCSTPTIGIFSCNYCPKTFNKLRFLKCHKHRMHREEYEAECQAEKLQYNAGLANDGHIEVVNESNQEGQPKKTEEDKEAEFLRSSESNYKRKSTDRMPKLQCDFCGDYIEENRYDKHIYEHNKIRLQKLRKPDVTTEEPVTVKTETPPKTLMNCHFCSRGFQRKHHLVNHINKHLNGEFGDEILNNSHEDGSAIVNETKDKEPVVKEEKVVTKGFECCGRAFRLKAHLFRHCALKHPTRFPDLESNKSLNESQEKQSKLDVTTPIEMVNPIKTDTNDENNADSEKLQKGISIKRKSISLEIETNENINVTNKHSPVDNDNLEANLILKKKKLDSEIEIIPKKSKPLCNNSQTVDEVATSKYECTHCNRSFKQVSQLRDHLLTHSGDRPHKCIFCEVDRRFTQSSALYVHYRRFHTKIVNNCSWETHSRFGNCLACFAQFDKHVHMYAHLKDYFVENSFECVSCEKPYNMACHPESHLNEEIKPNVQKNAVPEITTLKIECDVEIKSEVIKNDADTGDLHIEENTVNKNIDALIDLQQPKNEPLTPETKSPEIQNKKRKPETNSKLVSEEIVLNPKNPDLDMPAIKKKIQSIEENNHIEEKAQEKEKKQINKILKCKECDKTFAKRKQLKFHKKSLAHFQQLQSLRKQNEFINEKPLVGRIFRKYSEGRRHRCGICGLAFLKKLQLKKHRSHVHRKPVEELPKIDSLVQNSDTNKIEIKLNVTNISENVCKEDISISTPKNDDCSVTNTSVDISSAVDSFVETKNEVTPVLVSDSKEAASDLDEPFKMNLVMDDKIEDELTDFSDNLRSVSLEASCTKPDSECPKNIFDNEEIEETTTVSKEDCESDGNQ